MWTRRRAWISLEFSQGAMANGRHAFWHEVFFKVQVESWTLELQDATMRNLNLLSPNQGLFLARVR